MRAEPGFTVGSDRLSVAVVASGRLADRRLAAALERGGLAVRDAHVPAVQAVVAACARIDGDAVETLAAIRAQRPEAALVVVAGDASPRDVRAALDAGVDAFVVESRVEEGLAEAVRAARAGHLVLPREWHERAGTPILSPREKQVLGMVVMGFTNQEIANKLLVAESTVKSHLTSIFAKLGVRGRSEAAALVLDPEQGLGTGVLAILNGDAS